MFDELFGKSRGYVDQEDLARMGRAQQAAMGSLYPRPFGNVEVKREPESKELKRVKAHNKKLLERLSYYE